MSNTAPGRRATSATTVLALGLALALLSTPAVATAVSDGSLGIRPAAESDFFHFSLYPGADLDAVAIVSNRTGAPVTLQNYPVDAHTSAQGTFAMGAETDDRTTVGAWVHLNSADHIEVPGGSEVRVPFRISVPAATPAGDYAGAIIIQSQLVLGSTSPLKGGAAAVRLDSVQRQGVRIFINVAGVVSKRLHPGPLSWAQNGDTTTFTLPVRNLGNTVLHPAASLAVDGWFGLNDRLKFHAPESLLPGATYIFKARLQNLPFLTVGDAAAMISSEVGTVNIRTDLTYAPWGAGVAILLLLASFGYGISRSTRFIRKAPPNTLNRLAFKC